MSKKLVAIGGGNGLSNLLTGLKEEDFDITAVVSVMDSGGSAGVIRQQYDTLAYGDIRRALAALAKNSALANIFNHRFDKGQGLAGHTLGNLFLLALKQSLGSENKAFLAAEAILQIKGRVLPITLAKTHLRAELENGQVIKDEANIDVPKHNGKLRINKLYLSKQATINPEVKSALEKADIITIGPGDLYTSLVANLLIKGLPAAIKKSKAKKIWINNLTNKYGETPGFSLSNYLNEIDKYLGANMIDYVLYQQKPLGQDSIKNDLKKIKNPKILIGADFASKKNGKLIHNCKKIIPIIKNIQ